MKKIALILAVLLSAAGFAQERVVERTYVSTDRDVYVAGERIWYSAFCLDAARGTFSPISNVAYVELHDGETMVASGKVALVDGRGAGQLLLPAALPTGNYRLIAYTAQNKAERGYDFNGLASKTIAVFNVFSGERVKDGVEIVSEGAYEAMRKEESGSSVILSQAEGSLDLSWKDGSLTLTNHGDQAATLSLSVTHDDGILSNTNPTIADFMAQTRQVGPRQFDNSLVPEYEGEIIRGHITGFSEAMIPELVGKFAFISTPSQASDVYASVIDDEGKVAFYTGNIYGNKEYICEIEGINPSLNCFIELESPFMNAPVAPTEKLPLSPVIEDALLSRSVAMQIERQFTGDTLLDPLAVRQPALFGEDEIVYILDDYTRFTTMEEVLIEFVQELKARRRSDGSREIQVRLNDGTIWSFSSLPSLMMIDGVPVFDQEKILQYDPLLVQEIRVYPRTYFIGKRSFDGIANFVTYKHNLPGFQFGNNVRVVDYQGVSWPTAYTGASLVGKDDYPDYRQTIYWHPLLTLAPGQTLVIPFKIPDYMGRFKVSAEGLAADGTPVQAETSFFSK
jgi:hypothetical protein